MNFADDDFDYSEDFPNDHLQALDSHPKDNETANSLLVDADKKHLTPQATELPSRASWLSWNASTKFDNFEFEKSQTSEVKSVDQISVRGNGGDDANEVILPSFLSDSQNIGRSQLPRSARSAASTFKPMDKEILFTKDEKQSSPVKPVNWFEKLESPIVQKKDQVENKLAKNAQTKSFLDLILDDENKGKQNLTRPETSGKTLAQVESPNTAELGWPYNNAKTTEASEILVSNVSHQVPAIISPKIPIARENTIPPSQMSAPSESIEINQLKTELLDIKKELKMIHDSIENKQENNYHTLSEGLAQLQDKQQHDLSSLVSQMETIMHKVENDKMKELTCELSEWRESSSSVLQQIQTSLISLIKHRESLNELENKIDERKSDAERRTLEFLQTLEDKSMKMKAEIEDLRLECAAMRSRKEDLSNQLDVLQKQILSASEEKRRRNIDVENLKIKIVHLKDEMAPMKVYQRELHDQEVKIKVLQEDLEIRQKRVEDMMNGFHEEEKKLQATQALIAAENQKLESKQRQIDKDRAALNMERDNLLRERELTRNYYQAQWDAKIRLLNEKKASNVPEEVAPVEVAAKKFYKETQATTHLYSVAEKILEDEKTIIQKLKTQTEEIELSKKYRDNLNAINQDHWQFLAGSYQKALISPLHRHAA